MLLVYPNLLYKMTKKNDAVDSSPSYVVINKDYEFVLKEPSEGNYNVKSVDKMHKIPEAGNINFPVLWDSPSPSVEILIARNLVRGLCLSPTDWFPTLFEQPEFQLISAKEVVEGTERLVCVNYQYDPPQRKNQLARSGEVYLLPDHYWLIKKASVKLSEFNGKHLNTQITCEYDFESDTLPRLMSHKILTVEYDQIVQRNFTNYETVTTVRPEDFTLSHYDIPEPDFDGSQRIRPIRYILIGLGGLLIVLAFWMMYRKHQKKNNEKK
ncbi:hypothetical protein FACS189454_04660 [Planctomycetales bacterium]|nr:hypothetical protein FACS189454_04660 [Planctomycetales bacterium]